MSFICKFCNQEARFSKTYLSYSRYYCSNNHPSIDYEIDSNNKIISIISEINIPYKNENSIGHFDRIEYEWETDYKEDTSHISLRYDFRLEHDEKEIASINYNTCTDVEKENYERLVNRFFHDKIFVNYVKKLVLCS